MTDKEFGVELLCRLMKEDDLCFSCIFNPKEGICSNTEIDPEICYEGMKAFAEKENGNDKQRVV